MKEDPTCTFCGQGGRLIAGPSVYICPECVEMCADILKAQDDERREATERAKKAAE